MAVYYPIATFIFPNLQFQNKLLDLKYVPSFLVLVSQVKLFMSGLAVLFGDSIEAMLIFTCVAFGVLGVVSIRLQPCLAKKANIWVSCEYLVISWVMAGGVLQFYLKETMICLIFIVVGVVGIIISSFIISRCVYKTNGLFVCFNCCCPVGEEIPLEKEINLDHVDLVIPVSPTNKGEKGGETPQIVPENKVSSKAEPETPAAPGDASPNSALVKDEKTPNNG